MLSSVTVFPDSARVTRQERVALTPGLHKHTFADLPLALVPDSVRAGGQGAARAKLLGVSTRLENFAEPPAEAVRDLEAKIQTAEDADAGQIARAALLEKEQAALQTLAAQSEMFARGLALRNRTPEEQGAIFDFLTRRATALQTELLAIARDRRDRAKELDLLRRELRGLQSARPRQRYTATVELEVAEAGDLDLELTYVVNNAGWSPLYDIRLTASGLDVTYMAQVTQNTGEDWHDVALALSTAQPALSLTVPELDPWYIQPRPEPRPMYAAKRAAGGPIPQMMAAATRVAAESAPEPAAPAPLEVEAAAVSDAGVSLTYRLTARADIPGNGEPRKVTVGSFGLQPKFDYITAPKREAVCYRRATVVNASPYSLLPGAAQLFDGDNYLGVTELEFTAPAQEFELTLGADERLRVERDLAARDVDKTFIGDRRRIRYAYTIKLENLTPAAQTVTVRDQLPLARDEQIKVRLDSADPKPASQTDLNALEWKLTLDRGAKQAIRFDFSVEHPRTMVVIGLP